MQGHSNGKRLYIITGKGGVGKTSAALAFAKRLNDQGLKAQYLHYSTSSLTDKVSEPQEISSAKKMGIPYQAFNLQDASVEYVGKKMKSHTIGKWVVKTPFFKALVNMIPGFNYLIYLGKTLELLKADENLILVLDSPSSGHALTMLEATKNFRDIFKSGLLFEDTQKMLSYLHSDNFAKIVILALPTSMAANEAVDLRDELKSAGDLETEIYFNNSLKALNGIETIELPDFLKAKLNTEEQIVKENSSDIKGLIKHSLHNQEEDIVNDLTKEVGVLF